MSAPALAPVDPFDLPDWLGTAEVTWSTDVAGHRGAGRLGSGHLVRGRLAHAGEEHPCDLLAVDEAYPTPVADEDTRRLAHQAWRNEQVLLVEAQGRLALAVPGTDFGADRVLDALGRLAKAVGARPESYVAALRLGVVGHGG
ncbi:hypothetical protein [Nocardioides donggukensis]|uniref:Uncharacterized protein n=1 Tax=Nocardioides donggukensis TaxID=2774019 RepID=A0A927PZ45_9ACTN|nr:hypothetical protein [Nocardioides donggukensis]MBD8869533.1 hypothetical protein [Nocardioides donggukensis]